MATQHRTFALVAAGLIAVTGLSTVVTVDASPVRRSGVTAGTVTVVGSGFGHGVGMSQYGALGMARDGATPRQILRHYYTGVQVVPYPDDVDVRVNVVHLGLGLTLRSTAVDAGGGAWTLVPDDAAPVDLGPADTVVVTPSGGRLAVTVRPAAPSSGGSSAPSSGASSGASASFVTSGLGVTWSGTRQWTDPSGAATTLSVTSLRSSLSRRVRAYRWGTLRLSPVRSGVDAVLVLDLHSEYLRGVAEMPSSWPPAALQVQVVAARNYALTAAGTTPRASCGGCQLWDDTRSQVYAGWSKESERIGGVDYGARWVAAITATQASATTGVSVLYRGRPATTYFASSTGGRTRDAADVWGTSVPYLRSVDDGWSLSTTVNPSFARWTRTTSVSRVAALFGLPDLVSVSVVSRDAGGAARVVEAMSSDGTRRTLSGNVLSNRLGLPGAWIARVTLPGLPVPGSSATPSGSPSGSPSASPSGLPSASPSGSATGAF